MAGLDDTESEEAAVGKHLEGMRARMKEAKAEEEEFSTETPEPDEEEEDEESEVAPTRREKRASRQSARERLAAAEAEAKVLREQLAERSRPVPGVRQEAASSTAEIDQRIRATYAELERLENDYVRAQNDKSLTPAREAEMREKAMELEMQKISLAAERREIATAPARQKKEFYDRLASEFADVYGNPQAARYAYGRGQQLIAMGRPDDKALHDEVMAETRRVVLGVRDKPGAIEKQRATGMSAGPRTAAPAARKTIPMPKGSHYYKLALATYPDLDPGAACQKWAQTVGKNLPGMK